MPKHVKHQDVDLREGLEHVVYEIWKYKQSVEFYLPIQTAGGDAALEFRVLHHRVLLEFFYGPAKHPDNILASEYVDDWTDSHAPPVWLEPYMERCHTMLAHISTRRASYAKKGLKDWGSEFLVVEPHLDQLVADFLAALSQPHRRICRDWIDRWDRPNVPCSAALKKLIASPA